MVCSERCPVYTSVAIAWWVRGARACVTQKRHSNMQMHLWSWKLILANRWYCKIATAPRTTVNYCSALSTSALRRCQLAFLVTPRRPVVLCKVAQRDWTQCTGYRQWLKVSTQTGTFMYQDFAICIANAYWHLPKPTWGSAGVALDIPSCAYGRQRD